MAAVSVQLSPHVLHSMASRRAPLSNIPNAGNSPFRTTPGKRARAQAHSVTAVENADVQPPPSKRQIVAAESTGPITPRKGREQANPATPAQRQHAPRTREAIRTQKENVGESMEKLRQWQKHNEKTFPTYVFFFENVSENARRECSRGVRQLGSREVPFFSKDVTHVITTRAIPAEGDSNPSTDASAVATSPQQREKAQPKTIDPLMLEKDRALEALTAMQKAKFTFEAPRKPLAPAPDAENRNVHQSDILLRAKSMGIKIWGLDKLKRILDVMFEDSTTGNTLHARSKLSNVSARAPPARPQDLQQLISNEQLNGPTDRDAKGVHNELIPLRGPYLYVRCCFERVKPVMVREWPKVANRDDGEWPQFRSVSSGKCPFVEEDRVRKPAPKAERPSNIRQTSRENVGPPKWVATAETARMQPPALVGRKRPLAEIENSSKPTAAPQQLPPQKEDSTSRPGTSQGTTFPARSGLLGGEPMASGMQASNITSAIRSQVISSTAAAPGAKAGTSREMHGLQRKVLARGHGPVPALARSNGMANLADVAGLDGSGPSTRAAKQRAQERLGHSRLAQVMEGAGDGDEEEPETERADAKENETTAVPVARRKVGQREKRDPKPGFCENCREKYDDFDEHTLSKRHRKFATTKENWLELDNLLSLLGRPQIRDVECA